MVQTKCVRHWYEQCSCWVSNLNQYTVINRHYNKHDTLNTKTTISIVHSNKLLYYYYKIRLLTHHKSTFDGRIVGVDDIPWWSPSQVLATIHMLIWYLQLARHFKWIVLSVRINKETQIKEIASMFQKGNYRLRITQEWPCTGQQHSKMYSLKCTANHYWAKSEVGFDKYLSKTYKSTLIVKHQYNNETHVLWRHDHLISNWQRRGRD